MKKILLSLYCSYTILWYFGDWKVFEINSFFKIVLLSAILWGVLRIHSSSKFAKLIFSISSAISIYFVLDSVFKDFVIILNTSFVHYKTLLDQALMRFMNWDFKFESLTLDGFLITVFSLMIWYGFLSDHEWLRYVLGNHLLAFSIVIVVVNVSFQYTEKGQYLYFASPLLVSMVYHLIIERIKEGRWRIFFSSMFTYLLLCAIVMVMISGLEDGRFVYESAHYELWANRLFILISFFTSLTLGIKPYHFPAGKQKLNNRSGKRMSQGT